RRLEGCAPEDRGARPPCPPRAPQEELRTDLGPGRRLRLLAAPAPGDARRRPPERSRRHPPARRAARRRVRRRVGLASSPERSLAHAAPALPHRELPHPSRERRPPARLRLHAPGLPARDHAGPQPLRRDAPLPAGPLLPDRRLLALHRLPRRDRHPGLLRHPAQAHLPRPRDRGRGPDGLSVVCGIVGNVLARADRAPDPAVLTRMNERLTHRGPDDEGVLVQGPAGLAMRRLKIIDLATGHQPMAGEAGRVWIVYNGEIYNYQELRETLA